jgi:hypothetical protein
VDAIIRATNAPIGGDTFAPISRLLGEVLAARLAQVSGVMRLTSKISLSQIFDWLQLLPFICADTLEAAMPLLTSAAIRLGQVTHVCLLSLNFACIATCEEVMS